MRSLPGTDHPDSDSDYLPRLMQCLQRRNRELGLARYDQGDLLSHPAYFHLLKIVPGPVRKLLRIPEILAPLLWRKLLGVEKRLLPVTLYHLGMACYHLEQLGRADQVFVAADSASFADRALEQRLDSPLTCWGHPYRHHGHQWRDGVEGTRKDAPENSCAHHNARLGLLLARLAEDPESDFAVASRDVASALVRYHNWQTYADGTCTVSYYPTTTDEVVNTGAEVAVHFQAIAPHTRPDGVQERLEGLARMLAREQNPDGSWFYCTKRHYNRHEERKIIDNHHTAMVLAAVAQLQKEPSFSEELRDSLQSSLRRGGDYYLDHLVDPDGRAMEFPGSIREASLAGYVEGFLALGQLVEHASDILGDRRLSAVRKRVDLMMTHVLDGFVDPSTGDVASARFFGKSIHLQSIRLGSGLLLDGLARRLVWSHRGVLPAWQERECP